MKKLALYLIPFVFAASAAAQTKVGLIDIQRAVLSTDEGKSALEALNKKYEPSQSELQKMATELQDLQKKFDADGAKMSEDARAATLKEIEQKALVFRQAAERAQSDYNTEKNEILARVIKKMAPVLDKFAKDNGFNMIFDAQFWPAGPILWASGASADVTTAVVSSYNAQSPASAPAASAQPSSTAPANASSGTAPSGTTKP